VRARLIDRLREPCVHDRLGGITTPIVSLGLPSERGREMRRAFSPANAMHRRLNRSLERAAFQLTFVPQLNAKIC